MNYQRIYDQFIADRRAKESELIASGVYVERHHVLPKSLGGGNEPENLIALTAGDHFFAHELLARVHGGHMWLPLIRMCNPRRYRLSGHQIPRHAYEYAKKKHAAHTSVQRLNNPEQVRLNFKKAHAKSETIYEWENMKTGETFSCTWHEAHEKTGVPLNKLRGIACSIYSSYKGVKLASRRIATREEIILASNTPEAIERSASKQRGRVNHWNIGTKNHKAKAVRCVELDHIFDTITDAVKQTPGSHSANICRAIREGKTCGGYHWEYVS
jgi:hypothetical protein